MPQIVTVRELRKALAFHLNGEHAVVIGNHYHDRAILIPLSKHPRYNYPAQRKAIARAAKETLRVLAELRAEAHT